MTIHVHHSAALDTATISHQARTSGAAPDDAPVAELLFTDADSPISSDPSTVMAWSAATAQLAAASKFWLSTGRPDRRPHVAPVVAVWFGNALHLATRPMSIKARNLACTPWCVLTTATDTADLVVECRAADLDDPVERSRVLAAFEAKYQWRLTVRDDAVRDDNLPGSPAYALYRLTPFRAFGYGADGLTATRWRFDRTG